MEIGDRFDESKTLNFFFRCGCDSDLNFPKFDPAFQWWGGERMRN